MSWKWLSMATTTTGPVVGYGMTMSDRSVEGAGVDREEQPEAASDITSAAASNTGRGLGARTEVTVRQ